MTYKEKEKGGHGGRRAGAGRPRLSNSERYRYGAACEEEHESTMARVALQRAKKTPHAQQLRNVLAKLKHKRRHFRGPRKRVHQIGASLSQEADKIGRLYSAPLKRPKGYRAAIIRKIAKKFNQAERMIRTCWVEYRAFRRKFDSYRAANEKT